MAKIRWTIRAADDLEEIEAFIARDSPLHAVTTIDRIISTVERLEDHPLLGRIVPEFERDDLREIIYRSYRIIYLQRHDVATILRVVHGARDLFGVAEEEPWDQIQ